MSNEADRLTHRQGARPGLHLLNLSAWIRGQRVLQLVYRQLPPRWRNWASSLLASRASASARFPRTPRWDLSPDRLAHDSVKMPPHVGGPGLNLLGYMRGQFGLAESARLYARALIDSGADVALYDIDLALPHGWEDTSLDAWIGTVVPHEISIIFVNPDYLKPALEQIGEARLRGRYLVACWFWELEKIPDEWLDALALVDEIMVASKFVEDAFRRVTEKPVLRVPLPLSALPDSGLQRQDFGLEEGKFTFLATFDFNSWIERKNPLAVLSAFRAAFPADRDDVRLLVKSSNGFRHPDKFRALLSAGEGDDRIIIRDDVIDRAHLNALQRCCDAYVSLHRAEGFGLGLAECMALGKPVIATGWSGNLEFMDSESALLVGFRRIPVRDGDYPHPDGAEWAEADVGAASAAMRKLADDPVAATRLGARARTAVLARLSPENAARIILNRVREIKEEMNYAGENHG
ncbi:glycosyltransferase family 4 protein [Stenotrophomonas sp. Sa5BUN4]|uniref:Glycosyltransferase family 4 protein n=1 Tax=Stenotrophomonas lacuserhaii TaxID=2760084 RepID=A0A8X8FWW9_9GAMM|nr:glycosyltransferase family 4 protein [Stenotrophomonas pennii]MBD7955311.1 glycosyltransferase family 4 protein [Stenotrophomonas pennii]